MRVYSGYNCSYIEYTYNQHITIVIIIFFHNECLIIFMEFKFHNVYASLELVVYILTVYNAKNCLNFQNVFRKISTLG
jgi:hypothetical protein